MPGGKRTDRISGRDLEVLEFVARFGIVPRDAVAYWAGTARSTSFARERRLREASLVRVLPGFGDGRRLLLATRDGLRACLRTELPVARFSRSRVRHSEIVALVAAALERSGHPCVSEREIVALERARGSRYLSAEILRGGFHQADLLLSDDNVALEVELSVKAPERLDGILRGWRRAVIAGRVSGVRYICGQRAFDGVERAVQRTKTYAQIEVQPLRAVLPPGGAR